MYLEQIKLKNTTTIVFIDETRAYVGQSREYGWGSSHERVYDARPKGKKARVSLVAATSLNGAMAEQALVISDTVNKNAFLCFLETTLLPTLARGSVIVMDNWTVHHGDEVRELVERFGNRRLVRNCEHPHPPAEQAQRVDGIERLRAAAHLHDREGAPLGRPHRGRVQGDPVDLVLHDTGDGAVALGRAPHHAFSPLRQVAQLLHLGMVVGGAVRQGQSGRVEDARLAARGLADAEMRTAVLSSATRHCGEVLRGQHCSHCGQRARRVLTACSTAAGTARRQRSAPAAY